MFKKVLVLRKVRQLCNGKNGIPTNGPKEHGSFFSDASRGSPHFLHTYSYFAGSKEGIAVVSFCPRLWECDKFSLKSDDGRAGG